MGKRGLGPQPESDDLERWLEQGYNAAFRTAYLILHNPHDAEEAVQEAFLRAWRFRASVPPGEGVRPWMYRVVVNACLSKLRSERTGRERRVPVDGESALPPSPAPGPEEGAESGELRRHVVAALAGLPEHLRVVVVLRYYAGLSEREIGTVIHRRPGTVKSRIHEAKLRLGTDPVLAEYRPVILVAAGGRGPE
jgi:RNA polymerase sigma-70 factor (ECF subfamily)